MESKKKQERKWNGWENRRKRLIGTQIHPINNQRRIRQKKEKKERIQRKPNQSLDQTLRKSHRKKRRARNRKTKRTKHKSNLKVKMMTFYPESKRNTQVVRKTKRKISNPKSSPGQRRKLKTYQKSTNSNKRVIMK